MKNKNSRSDTPVPRTSFRSPPRSRPREELPTSEPPIRREKGSETKVYGRRAALALLASRPTDIAKVYVTLESRKEYQGILDYCVANKKGFDLVAAEELEKIGATTHHEGIIVIAKPRAVLLFRQFLEKRAEVANDLVLVLDGVENPHNLGAIIRTAAFFGASGIVLLNTETVRIASSVQRVSEGGVEFVDVSVAANEGALDELKAAGYKLLATSPHTGQSIFDVKITPRTAIILGSEERGISRRVLQRADLSVNIPGTGAIESLNVSSAVAVVLAAMVRPQPS